MLRRVARLLRVSLGVVGVCLAIMLPLSYLRAVWIGLPGSISIYQGTGSIQLSITTASDYPTESFYVGMDIPGEPFGSPFLPETGFIHVHGFKSYFVDLPLWLLAFLCLAWPVTSFIIIRWRRGLRGFEVEAVGGNAVSTVDS